MAEAAKTGRSSTASGAGASGTGIATVYKSFGECVKDITDLETGIRPVPPRIPRAGIGPSVEMFSGSYGEALAEIRRLGLVKEMCRRRGQKGSLR